MQKILVSLLILLSVLLPCRVTAQTSLSDANIIGHVIEKGTDEHLPGFTIRLLDSSIGVVTDVSGHYAIRHLAPGKYTVEASCAGYVTQKKTIDVAPKQTVELNFDVSPDAFQLEQVVVTGNKSEVKRRNSSSLINVLGAPTFDLIGASCLADGLCFQPGVRVENDCQNCGFTQVRINGLDGHYSQILLNSRPVFSALTGVYGLEQIPANMIERVEVMRGGGSALFGSSAIGGTINIITKDPIDNCADVAHTLTSLGVSGALENNTTASASVVSENNRIGLFIFGQNRLRDGYDHDGDGFTEIPQLKTQTLGFRTFMRTSDYSKLSLEYHGTHEYRRGGDQLDEQPHMAMVAEQTDHNIHAVDISTEFWTPGYKNRYSVFASTQNTRRTSYYGSEMDPEAYGRTHDLVVVAGGQYIHSFDRLWFMPSELTAGVEYNYNYLNDVTLGYNHDVTQCVNIFSGYLQNEWRTDRWGFLVGARVDKHSLISHPIVSPRANVRFNPSSNLNFRLSYSTGFRSPQAYDEDFHVAVVGGERVVTILAPDLKQESSQSLSASMDLYHNFGNVQTNFLVDLFYTDLSDVFILRRLEEVDAEGNAVLERCNGAGARVYGVNLEAKANFPFKLQIQAGLTLQKSRYKEPEYWSEDPEIAPVRRMFRTPDTYGYFTATYNPVKPLQIALSGTYSGSMLVQHLAGSGTSVDVAVNTPDFFDAGLKVSYDFRIYNHVTLQLNAGIHNIFNSYQKDFDRGHLRDSGYIYGPTMPRSIFAGVKLHI
ncbi:MAG: TonB-dependent receptor [Duncaniella sp.]|nr:TonB-dependent receptor [Duncaniella sp.]